ncbi:MAG: HAMP domain-containing histidine kinase [Ruminococcus sp.]|nr:HAMP domain-containing histidine kinase [Ruminococcus sp.]MBR1751371.1 HAMP domain-containing histidine kinase [Ruminococcus sp.]
MKKSRLSGLYMFLIFFVLISFVVTCSFILFFTFLDFSAEQIKEAAPITFGNVIFISLIFCGLDALRRKVFTERPIGQIISGLEKISKGDFTVRIEPVSTFSGLKQYNEIISYINKMTAELGSVETLRTDFVSNVSHEMKTPLSVIQNYSSLLQSEGITPKEREEYAKNINAATKRLASLITNILKLNKLENQQIFPERERFDLSEQLCTCLLDFESEWERKNIDIETDIQDEVEINSDPELLTLVWNNLFSNALKFTDDGGKVSVSMHSDGGEVTVSVTDTGCGIDAETGRHIFDKFYQGDTSHAAKGNGLGLALVKRIIDITGGEIGVNSAPGKGSTFTVTLRKEDSNE